MEKDYLLDLMRSTRTVFTFKDLILLWKESDTDFVKKKIHRYVKSGKIHSIRKGIYAKDKNYDRFELATKIYTPAYISFETVTGATGLTFQYYKRIFAASPKTKEISCDNQIFSFQRMPNEILTNHEGIIERENYSIATPERAFLDMIYSRKDYHFDNLVPLNWEKVDKILPVYGGNKRMEKTIKMYQKGSQN